MVFASDSFVFLFLPVFLLVYAAVPGGFRNTTILVFSWIFYAWSGASFLLLLVAISIWSWATGLWLAGAAPERRRVILAIAIAFPLLALGWFKYANLLVGTAGWLGAPVSGWRAVVLPIGLSFFVFGAISYSVDVYRHTVPAEPSLINYATYQSMFGHLVAGPIVRYEWVAARLHERAFLPDEFAEGAGRFMLGFAQKILLADTLAPMVDAGYLLERPTTADAALAVVAYTLQLYFDFAAYSSMAIGLGLMVGLRFHENFRTPYLSTSLPEFWRRWHISLSTWLRDYLYIPLGGNRCSLTRSCMNLLVTMGLGGLWHGASWTFLVWGLWHGMGLMVARVWRAAERPSLSPVAGHFVTLLFVMVGWAFFRAQDWHRAAVIARAFTGANGLAVSGAFAAALRPMELAVLGIGVIAVYAPLLRPALPSFLPQGKLALVAQAPLWLLALWVLQGRTVVPFLYFRF